MVDLYYGYYSSPIGVLEIITSKDAILSAMFVEIGKENDTAQPEILREAIHQFKEYFQGERKAFDLKLGMCGTDYQKKVWEQLLAIPYGSTISYKELAIRVGDSKATRAVGNANGKNKISIIVPCHRVIGSDHSLTGYAGGLERKHWLLEHEKGRQNF